MSRWIGDIRHSLRGIAATPLFTAVVVFSLALGIGANTAVFSLLDQLILRLLPVHNPQELVLLSWKGSFMGSNTGQNALSYPMYKDFRDRNEVFQQVFCRYGMPFAVGYNGQTERVDGELVSGNYFESLGIGAAAGRVITPAEDARSGGNNVAVLSYNYWVERFRKDPAVLGRRILINGQPLTIIGVSAPGFDGIEVGSSPRIRVPVTMKKQMMPGMWAEIYNLDNRRARWINVFGRLKPGVSIKQAHTGMQPLFHSLLEMEVKDKEFAKMDSYSKTQFLKSTLDVLPAARGRSMLREQFSTPLWVLMSLVGLVLLIACANVANLLMARAAGRKKEFALRLALGAHPVDITRQLVTESILLSVVGAVAGILFAWWMDGLLLHFLSGGDIPSALSATPDARVLGFTLLVAFATGLIFGLFPAVESLRVDLAPTLKNEATAVIGGSFGLRKALVVTQVFLSTLLLVGAGLFIRSLQNLQDLNPGFKTESLTAFSVDPLLENYSKEKAFAFYRQLSEKLAATPGVSSTALGLVRVLDGDDWENSIAVEGHQTANGEDMNPYFNGISSNYFATLGMHMLAGREFLPSDSEKAHKVGIVNEIFARRFFGSVANAMGRHFGFGGGPDTKLEVEIVGVAQNAKYNNMRDAMKEQIFVPYLQMDSAFQMTGYLKTSLDAAQTAAIVRSNVHQLDAKLPIYKLNTMGRQIDESLSTERMIAFLAGIFGIVATLLAAIGLYGVLAYSVEKRVREIGIRLALGANRHQVVWLVMRDVLILLAIGLVLALPAALGSGRFVKSQLYGLASDDLTTLLLACAGIGLVGILAGYIPAARAASIDPNQALRYD